MKTLARKTLLAAACGFALMSAYASVALAGSYAPPQDVYVSTRGMEALAADIAGGRPTDAVERLEGFFNDPSAKFVRIDDTRVVSVRDWVNAQLTDSIFPTRFREQYEKVAGQAAQNALADATHAGDVPAMLAVAERYPWTTAAQQVPVEAAQRLLALGDVRGAKDMLARVGLPDKTPAALKAVSSFADDATLPSAPFSTHFLRAKGSSTSPLSPPALAPRLVPVASAEAMYLASPTAMVALSKQGRLLWTIIDPPVELPPPPPDQPKSMAALNMTDFSLAKAAVWCDPTGAPRVLVARQSTPFKSSLRAVRPQDGSIIWTTLSSEQGGDLLYVGTPAISGRYVYSMAIAVDPAVGYKLCLVALELASGKVLFNTEIGAAERNMAQQVRVAKGDPDPMLRIVGEFVFRDSTTLSVDAQNVYVAPGGGSVWCVDRFGGAIRWVSQYPANKQLTQQQEREQARDREKEKQDRIRKKLPPLPPSFNVRWQNNVLSNGKAIIVAPTDSKAVVAIDIASGKPLWTNDKLPDAELAVVQGDLAVLASANKLVGVRTTNGEQAWETPLPAEPTGPAFVDGDSVGILSTAGTGLFTITDGQPANRDPAGLILDTFLRTPVTKTQFQTADLLRYFGDPPAVQEKAPEKPAKPEKSSKDKKLKAGEKLFGG